MATAETVMAVTSREDGALESRMRSKDSCPVWGEGAGKVPSWQLVDALLYCLHGSGRGEGFSLTGGLLAYFMLRVVNRRMDRVYLCELFDLPARDWRDEYDGRVPPAEAVDVAIDEYASKHGTGPVTPSGWMPPGS